MWKINIRAHTVVRKSYCNRHLGQSELTYNINISKADVYGDVIVEQSLPEFTRCIWWMQNSARWLPTFGPALSARDPSPVGSCNVYVDRCHLLLFNLKAGTHFTVSRRVEGWVDLMFRYVLRWFTCSQTVTHPSSIRAWHRATSLLTR